MSLKMRIIEAMLLDSGVFDGRGLADLGSVEFDSEAGAVFDKERRHRHILWRCWTPDLPLLGFCGLNPSRAGASAEDATSLRFRGFAERLGFGGYVTVNQSDFIETKSLKLIKAGYPMSPSNDRWIEVAARSVDKFACVWGSGGNLDRQNKILSILAAAQQTPYALRVNKDGSPGHPLYLPYTCELTVWSPK